MQDNRLEDSLGYALVRAFRAVNRTVNRALRKVSMSPEQAHILLVLWLEGPVKVGELQRILGLSSGTLTGAIDRMVEAKLVKRAPDPDDGRAWRIEPAAMPAKKRDEVESLLEGVEEACFSVLSSSERRQLFQLLEKVTNSLE